MGTALLQLKHVVKDYSVAGTPRSRRKLQAVSDVSFDLDRGQTLALVGESGSGKSSLAKAVLQSPGPTSGEVRFKGVDLVRLRGSRLRQARRGMQVVFQDPFSSLNPRWTVTKLVEEPLVINDVGSAASRRDEVERLLDQVGLEPRIYAMRQAGELSGGQCQRVAIARALSLHPDLLICDEPVSALDVSVQAQILNVFERLRTSSGLAYLFITHDLAVAKRVSDRVAVMYLGKVVEMASSRAIYAEPRHPYSAALLSAIPSGRGSTGSRIRLQGSMPTALDPPSGCRFHTRCPQAQPVCSEVEPTLTPDASGHAVACHFPLSSPRT